MMKILIAIINLANPYFVGKDYGNADVRHFQNLPGENYCGLKWLEKSLLGMEITGHSKRPNLVE